MNSRDKKWEMVSNDAVVTNSSPSIKRAVRVDETTVVVNCKVDILIMAVLS